MLTVTEMLRKKGVVGKFVEFFGDGLANLPLADRATIANMAPEYGSTCGIFPVDAETLRYLELSGRSAEQIAAGRGVCKAQGLLREHGQQPAQLHRHAGAGPRDGRAEPRRAAPPAGSCARSTAARRVYRAARRRRWRTSARRRILPRRGKATVSTRTARRFEVKDGDVLIAAITSCTNTSNPSVMLAAGLLANNAVERGLKAKPWVKTSLAPGSRVVTDYLAKAGLTGPSGSARLLHSSATGVRPASPRERRCCWLTAPVAASSRCRDAGGARAVRSDADGRLAHGDAEPRLMDQGMRDCVSLRPAGRAPPGLHARPRDPVRGRTLGARRSAELDEDRVVVGLEAPLDEPGDDEAGYVLRAGELTFTWRTPMSVLRTLAFARLLGHLLGDGSISVAGQGRMNVGQARGSRGGPERHRAAHGQAPGGDAVR